LSIVWSIFSLKQPHFEVVLVKIVVQHSIIINYLVAMVGWYIVRVNWQRRICAVIGHWKHRVMGIYGIILNWNIYLIICMTNAIIGKFISRNNQQSWWSNCSVRFRLFICTHLVMFPLIMRLAVEDEPSQVLVYLTTNTTMHFVSLVTWHMVRTCMICLSWKASFAVWTIV